MATGRYALALESARQAVDISVPALSADHWRTAVAESAEGAALTRLGRYAEAGKLLQHSNEILARDNAGAPLTYRALARRYLEDLHSRQAASRAPQHAT